MRSTDNSTTIGPTETLSLLGRSLGFVWPYLPRVFVKLILSLIGVSVVLILPWPLKVLVDHVVVGMPIGDSPTLYPPYVEPLIHMLEGMSPAGIVASVVAISVVGLVLIGAFRTEARDSAEGDLAQGLDTATRSENLANTSASSVGGLVGLFEYRFQLRITHRINHDLRTRLYHRLMAQPMTRFADASIGDSVYRVMYDTPAISRVCYDILVTPLGEYLYLVHCHLDDAIQFRRRPIASFGCFVCWTSRADWNPLDDGNHAQTVHRVAASWGNDHFHGRGRDEQHYCCTSSRRK